MKRILTIGIAIAILIVYFDYVARKQIVYMLQIIVPVLIILLVIGSLCFGALYLLMLREKWLILREERHKAGREIITMPDGQVYVRETDNHSTYRQLHTNPRHYINGHEAEPTDIELLTFQAHQARRQKSLAIASPKVIEGQTVKRDLLHIMTQEQSAYAIIGAQRSGKSFQAMAIAYHWLSRNVTPMVIGPKMLDGQWIGCNKSISHNIDVVSRRLDQIRLEAISRNDSGQSSKVQPVFLDDWLWCVFNVDNAGQFFQDASTILASANIVCYFIMHSDNAKAYSGDGKFGAMLKNSLTKYILEPIPDQNGIIVPGQSRGFIQYPNSRDKLPVDLLEMPDRNSLIQTLHNQGLSKKEIALQVYKGSGGKQIKLVERNISNERSI